jgi:hypothetical protein
MGYKIPLQFSKQPTTGPYLCDINPANIRAELSASIELWHHTAGASDVSATHTRE